MSTYHSTGISITGSVSHSPGLATIHENGRVVGHVSIYADDGSLSVSADDPETLRSLSVAFAQAADELLSVKTEAVPA